MPGTPEPELTWEHEAIRKQIKFLTDSLSGVADQACKGSAQPTPLKEQITLYRWSLYDFRETLKRHIDVDERFFGKHLGTTPIGQLNAAHDSIQKHLDQAISLAEDATYKNLSQDELTKCATKIKEAVDKLFELIEAHTAKEDRLWKMVQG